MRLVLLALAIVTTGCSQADWNAFWGGASASQRGGNKALQQSNGACYTDANCQEPGAVCMVPQGASQGTCMTRR